MPSTLAAMLSLFAGLRTVPELKFCGLSGCQVQKVQGRQASDRRSSIL